MDQANVLLDRFLEPVRQCLTKEQAMALVKFRLDEVTQKHIDELARKCNEGSLTERERSEYEGYVEAGDLIAILQTKAREILDEF